MTASSDLGSVEMVPWVCELVATRVGVCWAVMPADATFNGLAADPTPVTLAVLASHVVASSVFLRLEIASGAALGSKHRGVRTRLPDESSLVRFAVAVLPVSPRVVEAEFSSAASLTAALHFGLRPALNAVWLAKFSACGALSQILICSFCSKKMQFTDNIGLICQQRSDLVRRGHSSSFQFPALASRHPYRTKQFLNATILDAAFEVDLHALMTSSVRRVVASGHDLAASQRHVLIAYGAEESCFRLCCGICNPLPDPPVEARIASQGACYSFKWLPDHGSAVAQNVH